jgi:predicted anti-sigma-YlaC factor YlaD
MADAEDLSCAQVVELVTEYLERTLDRAVVRRLEGHLDECDGCAAYLDQMRTTIELTGRLGEETLAPELRAALVRALREA